MNDFLKDITFIKCKDGTVLMLYEPIRLLFPNAKISEDVRNLFKFRKEFNIQIVWPKHDPKK